MSTAGMTYNPYIRMCAPASSPKVLAATPIAPTAYELFLTSLTLLKSYDISKHSKMSETPLLLRVVARDGVAYFILSTLLSLGNMISWHLLPPSLMYLLLYLYWALLSTVIAALVLNLRRVHYQVLSGESTTLGSAVSANVTCHGSSGTDQARGAQRPRRGAAGMEKSADLWSQGSRFIMGDGELGVDSDVDTNTTYQNSREESRRTASRPDVESALECPELNSNGESTNAQHDASLLMQRLERTSLAPANWS
ncbi:hypothetical protein FRC17_007447 [Serendipita sp. 399]|nr:hypothetical protein FRC17_007447 [Serendipita sp. 399]